MNQVNIKGQVVEAPRVSGWQVPPADSEAYKRRPGWWLKMVEASMNKEEKFHQIQFKKRKRQRVASTGYVGNGVKISRESDKLTKA